MVSRMNLHSVSPFYKSPHLLPCFEPTHPCQGAVTVKQNSRFQRRKEGNIKGKRRCCHCLLSCAWDDKHWEAFIWVLFSRFSSHKGGQWTGLILCKRFGAFQNHKTSLGNSQSTEWEAEATVLCHFLTSCNQLWHLVLTELCHWQRVLDTQKSMLMKTTLHNTQFALVHYGKL